MLPKESNSRKGPSWIFLSDSYLLIYFYIHYFTHIQILPFLTPYWASSCINKMWLIKPYTFHHPKHWFSKSTLSSTPLMIPAKGGRNLRVARRQGDMRQAQYEQGPAVEVRSKLLVSDPDHPGIRTVARWPRVATLPLSYRPAPCRGAQDRGSGGECSLYCGYLLCVMCRVTTVPMIWCLKWRHTGGRIP